ncbi:MULTISPECIES: hypothetical protein [unclassified Thiomonas]|jgi:hypothetical protein|uniref:hypothetical protein n=1 Tax=unclassified Thiomonas TaxID=2625466 RepID=UPI0012A9C0E2|nr:MULTISPECIES: hypothetical protein [unclassified Thiomonas]VDY04957.1 protein of unknown function [Thiomonas sp. Bio17B3]VDY17586.1 protein of unknown function [Thiomonas sp. CB2]
MATGDVISTSRAAAGSNAWGMLRDMPVFPAGLDRRQTLELFREMNARGLLERREYIKPNRHAAERWELTPAGYDFAGIAPPAPACVSKMIPMEPILALAERLHAIERAGREADELEARLIAAGVAPEQAERAAEKAFRAVPLCLARTRAGTPCLCIDCVFQPIVDGISG